MAGLRRTIVVVAAATLAAAGLVVVNGSGASAAPFGFAQLNTIQRRLVSGLLSSELNQADAARAPAMALSNPRPAGAASPCGRRLGPDVKVNQDCLTVSDADLQGRGQAQNETWIAADPHNGDHLVATYNDYRRGDGTCGVTYSLDGGRSWADATTPNGFTRGTAFGGRPREYWQAGGDPSVAWDSRGNAYLNCQVFLRGDGVSPNPDQSSAMYVFRSTGSNGASWNFPGHAVAEHDDTAGAGDFLLDKPLMAVDSSVGSRFRDRVYVTWTTFAADGTSYLYGAYSADYAQTFSDPVLISRGSPLCDDPLGIATPQGACNTNQFSQPFTAPDGTLYVVWNNYNVAQTGDENRLQVLAARSTDGGASFTQPVRVGFANDLPDCATYQNGADPGRSCVPESGQSTNSIFRATNYPIGAVDPTRPGRIAVTYGSYISRDSNERNGCAPAGFAADANPLYTGVKSGSCNNSILLSVSTDGGASFTGTGTDPRRLTSVGSPGQGHTDQYFQGAGFAPDGTLAVSYYDRRYGQDNATGYSDVTVSRTRDLATFADTRATSSSMPPPTQFSGLFYGDYAGVAVTAAAVHPLWSDTRTTDLFLCPGTGTATTPPEICQASAPNAQVANDEDIFTVRLPMGR